METLEAPLGASNRAFWVNPVPCQIMGHTKYDGTAMAVAYDSCEAKDTVLEIHYNIYFTWTIELSRIVGLAYLCRVSLESHSAQKLR